MDETGINLLAANGDHATTFASWFDDVVVRYLLVPGNAHHERFQKVAPRESLELQLPILLEARVNQMAGVESGVLSRPRSARRSD